MYVSDHLLLTPAALTQQIEPLVCSGCEAGWLQRLSGHSGNDNCVPLPWIEPGRPVRTPDTTLTELSRLNKMRMAWKNEWNFVKALLGMSVLSHQCHRVCCMRGILSPTLYYRQARTELVVVFKIEIKSNTYMEKGSYSTDVGVLVGQTSLRNQNC